MLEQRLLLPRVISEPIVFCENDPFSTAHFRDPLFVCRIGWEVVIVDLDRGAGRAKRNCNHALSERTIYKKTWDSGGLDGEFTTDRLFNLRSIAAVISR